MKAISRISAAELISFFFFQAEDGIRDRNVTGVQTCALPILLGIGVGHDPAPDLKIHVAAERETGADDDAQVEGPTEAPIADRAAVHGALGRLELGDDLHGPHFGRSCDRSAGKRRAQEIRRVVIPRGRVPFIGRASTSGPSCTRRNRSGDELATTTSPKSRYAAKGAGFTRRSRAYSSSGGSRSGAWSRCDRFAWKMSPA